MLSKAHLKTIHFSRMPSARCARFGINQQQISLSAEINRIHKNATSTSTSQFNRISLASSHWLQIANQIRTQHYFIYECIPLVVFNYMQIGCNLRRSWQTRVNRFFKFSSTKIHFFFYSLFLFCKNLSPTKLQLPRKLVKHTLHTEFYLVEATFDFVVMVWFLCYIFTRSESLVPLVNCGW